MTRKPQAASLSGLLARKGEAPPPQAVALRSEPEPAPEPVTPPAEAAPIAAEEAPKDAVNMNFRMSVAFRREFRRWAVDHDMQHNDVLRAAFEALKKAES